MLVKTLNERYNLGYNKVINFTITYSPYKFKCSDEKKLSYTKTTINTILGRYIQRYFYVKEKTKEGNLHLHGMIKLKEPHIEKDMLEPLLYEDGKKYKDPLDVYDIMEKILKSKLGNTKLRWNDPDFVGKQNDKYKTYIEYCLKDGEYIISEYHNGKVSSHEITYNCV